MDANGLNFWMLSRPEDWPLSPPPSASGSAETPAPNMSSLEASVGVADTQIVLLVPLAAGAPAFVLVDSEVMRVSAVAASGLQLTVTRGAQGTIAANHPPGALVWGPVTVLHSAAVIDDTQLIVVPAAAGAIVTGTFLQIGTELLAVTGVNPRAIVSVTRGALGTTPAAYGAGAPVFAPIPSNTLYYCPTSNRLRLLSTRLGNPPVEDFPTASSLVETTPMARDSFGNYARWDAPTSQILAGGSGPGEVPIYSAPTGQVVTDLTMGADGILYVAVGGTLVLIDRQDRWPNFTLSVNGFDFWRLAALPDGGVLALDRTKPQLGRVTGAPLQTGPVDTPAPGILRSCEPNPNPPRIAAVYPLPSTEVFVGLTAVGQQFALLSWAVKSAANTASFLRLSDFDTGLGIRAQLQSILWPYSAGWLGDRRVAVLATGLNEALIFDLAGSGTLLVPGGDTYALSGNNKGPFAHSPGQPPYYADHTQLLPLLKLSLNSLAGFGSTDPRSPKIVDSGVSRTVWHRLFLEAVLPPRCSIVIWLTAAEQPSGISAPTATWYPHVFGDADTSSLPGDTPQGVWLSIPSEAPFAQPLLGATPVPNRQGLFMVLVQRAFRAVRSLTGRFLGIRVELYGDRRTTPEVAALRVWASRFSYVNNYLPELYRETTFGPAGDTQGNATRYDFFQRFVTLFEAQLTRIEDRVANAYLLMRPESAPDDALDWLGSWIGLDPTGYPPDRRRARLLASASLHRQRGTARGVSQALDLATNGLCSRGAVIVVEDFRLRHIFATILGANLTIQNDPLLPGRSGASNSFVGDTLFLGNLQEQSTILALFSAALPESPAERAQVQQVYDNLANRMTVFIHNQVETVDMNLIKTIVESEKPAHVAAAFQVASQPFMVGLAALLGIDSYLAPEPPRDPVVLDSSQIGRYNMVVEAPSLDPRLET
jgi:phage tail-like protein